MKRLYAALLASALVLPAIAHAADHKTDKMDKGDWHSEICTDHYAHAIAKLAFLQVKLGITEAQLDAWNKFDKAESDGAARERDACVAEKMPSADNPPTVLDQEDRLEKMLAGKLDQLRASRPALEDLYKVLSSDQKAEFDHFGEEMGHRWKGHDDHQGMKGPEGHDGG